MKKKPYYWCCKSFEQGCGHTCHMPKSPTPSDWKRIDEKELRDALKGALYPESAINHIVKAVYAYKPMLEILEAMDARIQGQWDHPALKKFGALGDLTSDLATMIDQAIDQALAKAQ